MKFKFTSLLNGSFILLCIILFCNLNGVIFLLYGVRAPFSPIILTLCLLIIFIGIFVLKIKLHSFLIVLLITFYITYLYLGLCSYFLDTSFKHPTTSILSLIRSYSSSIPVILAVFIGAKSFILQNRLDYLILLLFSTMGISALFILIGPSIGFETAIQSAEVLIRDENRQYGLFANPNEAGSFGLYFMIISLTAFSYFRKGSILFIMALFLGGYVIFTSFSRAAILIAVLLILLYFLYYLRFLSKIKFSKLKKPLLIGSIVIVGSFVAFQQFSTYVKSLSYGQRTRLLQTFQLVSGKIDEKTTSNRSELYSFAWSEIKKRPITGYGLGSFHRMKMFYGENKLGVHNTQLMILGESGIIPFLMFCMVYILLGLYGWNHNYDSLGFFILSVTFVYFINVAGAGHNALDERISNAMVAISIAFSQVKKSYS